jgi:hypothetical protein
MSLQTNLNVNTLQSLLQVENIPLCTERMRYHSAIPHCLNILTNLAGHSKEEIKAINAVNWDKIEVAFQRLNRYVLEKGPEKSYLSVLNQIEKIQQSLIEKRGKKSDEDLAFRIGQIESSPFLLNHHSNTDLITELFATNLMFLASQPDCYVKTIQDNQWYSIFTAIHQLCEHLKKDPSKNSSAYQNHIIAARNALLEKRHPKRVS